MHAQRNMKLESTNFFALEILILTFQPLVMSDEYIFNSSSIFGTDINVTFRITTIDR